MRYIKPALTALAFATAVTGADAIIAKGDVMTITNSDGTTLRIKKTGDEALHFTTTEDGILLHEANGVFTYGRLTESGILESTGVKARDLEHRSTTEAVGATLLSDIDMEAVSALHNADARRVQSYMPYGKTPPEGMQRAPQTGKGLRNSTFPTKGSTKGLIILVEYKDLKFSTEDPARYFNDMINKIGFDEYGGTGSVLDYFTEQSGGKFTPDFDVYGPVTLNGNREEYGGNTKGGTVKDNDAAGMVAQAVQALDATVDFSQYDTDGDGEIDNIYVFYAGQGEASYGPAESVWPHSWDVRYGGYNITVDGVIPGHYACSNEWGYDRPVGIGTFIHEFSHVMGLPDLYETSGLGLTCTPRVYSCMDVGSYNNGGCTPPNYSAYEKNALGWFEPIILDRSETLSLDPISSGKFALIPTSSDNEFFLLENRQQTGWDAFIPGHGMLIWHIDYVAEKFNQNKTNNNPSHQYVDIVEANNTPNNNSLQVMEGWPFPGSTDKTEFTSTTTPALKTWDGVALDVPITNIEESTDGIISFDVMGGGTRLDVPAPTANTPGASDRYFVASWPAVAGATDYVVSVYAVSKNPGGTETVGFDGSKLPDGWVNSLSNKWYTDDGTYEKVAPSFRMYTDGQTLTSPVFPSDIHNFQYWIKGQGANVSLELYIGMNIGGTLSDKYYNPIRDSIESLCQFNEEFMPKGVRQIRFRLKKGVGDLALDDIVIQYGEDDELLDDYAAVSTGGATTLLVDRLKGGYDQYYFTVTAKNDRQYSRTSKPVYVTVLGMGGVEDIVVDNVDAPVEYYNLQGVRVTNPTSGNLYIEKRGTAVRKVIVR